MIKRLNPKQKREENSNKKEIIINEKGLGGGHKIHLHIFVMIIDYIEDNAQGSIFE